MTRDDSILNTGATSASFAPREQKLRTDKREEQHEKRLKLLPAGELINAEFEKQINTLLYSPFPDEDKMTDAQFRVERKGRRLAIKSLLMIQNRLAIILREPKKARNE